jgi:hypothetical protein
VIQKMHIQEDREVRGTSRCVCSVMKFSIKNDYISGSVISDSLSPRIGASSDCGWRNGVQYGG